LRPADRIERLRLQKELGDALANAGRGAEAAEQYLAAAAGANATEALELNRRAAMQLLISGHIDEGVGVLRAVLSAGGMKLPTTPRRALWSLLQRRAYIRLRGLGFRAQAANQAPAEDLIRTDIYWTAAVGLSLTDVIIGADFHARSLLLSLRVGEPNRIARALALEAGHLSAVGISRLRRTTELLQRAEDMARQGLDPSVLAMVLTMKGVVACHFGRWRTSLAFCDHAEEVIRSRCIGATWEIDTAHSYALWSLGYMGELAELNRRYSALIKEARERGDLYALMNMGTDSMALARLAADDPEGVRSELREFAVRWLQRGFHAQHHSALQGEVNAELYSGRGLAAWELVASQWPHYKKSLIMRAEIVRVEALQMHARCALAAATSDPEFRPLLRAAERDARQLEQEEPPRPQAHAKLIRAGVAGVRGDIPRAIVLLADAAQACDTADMRLHAAAARRRLGEFLGGDEGRDLVDAANRWMASQGIRKPDRIVTMYVPGFPD
jgi:hypothetical protein